MPDVLPTINNEPAQGIQATLDTLYLWNPDVANELIEQINALLEELEGVSGTVKPYSELEAPVKQYVPMFYGDGLYVAAEDMEELPAEPDLSDWILVATKATDLTAGDGIVISDGVISVTQAISQGAAAGATAVQPGSLGTAAYAATTDFATASQGAKADTAVQPADLGTAAYAATTDFATAAQGAKADTALQPGSSVPQYSTMPVAASTNVGEIVQYIGAPASGYTTGYFYKCVEDDGVYSWENVNVQDEPSIGRFLSLWNCATGLAETNPPQSPYTYRAGDYFIVGTVSSATPAVNYKPNGATYVIGTASSTVESDEVYPGDSYFYDGTAWRLQSNTAKTVTFASIAGDVYDNQSAAGALNAKQDALVSGTNIKTINGSSILGSGDITTEAIQLSALPTASAAEEGNIYQFVGTTGTYTNGYFYKCVHVSVSATATSSNPDVTVSVDAQTFAEQVSESGQYVFEYDAGPDAWYDSDNNQVNLTDFGISKSGASISQDTITVDYVAESYDWQRTDVQPAPIIPDPLPDQTGNAGKFLTTDGTDASWSDKPLVNNSSTSGSLAVGELSTAPVVRATAVGIAAEASKNYATAVGYYTWANALHAIQLGCQSNGNRNAYNGDANTFKVANANGNYEIMSADGTVPTDRFTTTPTVAGTYSATIVVDGQGNITRSWATAPDPLPSQTGNAGKFLTTDGSTASWGKALANVATSERSYIVGGVNTTSYTDVISIGYSTYEPRNTGSIAIGSFSRVSNSSVAIGYSVSGVGVRNVAIGYQATTNNHYAIAVGPESYCIGIGAIQLGKGSNSVAGTFQVGLVQDTAGTAITYRLLEKDGTIPTDRFTTTPVADGTYVPKLTISSGVATRTWGAVSGGGSVPTLTWYSVSTAGNTLTIADTSSAQLVKIYKNGLLLQPTEDYTISGTTLTTVGALVVGDKITTEVF